MSKEIADQISNELRVVKTSPKNLKGQVGLEDNISVTFNDDVDANTLNSNTFRVFKENTTVPGELKYAPDERKAVFKPQDDLEPGVEYNISLSGDIKSIAGYSLKPYSFTFYTQNKGYNLSTPGIVHPADNEVHHEPVIKWEKIEGASRYDIEVARRPDFNDLAYAASVIGKQQIRPDIDSDNEYFIRLRASKVVTDDLKEQKLTFAYKDFADNYLGNNEYKIELDQEYAPIEEVIPYDTYPEQIGARVFEKDCYEGDDPVDEITMVDNGHSIEGNFYIHDDEKAVLIIKYPFEDTHMVEFSIRYPVVIARSPWSDVKSFYYDETAVDFETLMEQKFQQEEKKSFIEVEETINVDTNSSYIDFKVYYSDISIDSLDINLRGDMVNDRDEIGAGNNHGLLTEKVKTSIALEKDELYQSNENLFEYEFEDQYTPLGLITSVKTDDGDDITDNVSIIGEDDELIEIEHDLSDVDHIEIKFEYPRAEMLNQAEDHILVRYKVPGGFNFNNRYTLQVKAGDQVFYDHFYTQLKPLYSTVRAVRNSEVGPHLEAITDEDILMKIFEVSQYVDSEADRDHLDWDKSELPFEDSIPPYPVRKFVLEKTKHDLIMFRDHYKRMKYRSGSLADFDITSPDAGQFQPLLDELNSKVERWRNKIIGPSTDYAEPYKNDDFVGRPNLERNRKNSKLRKRINEKGRSLLRGEGEGEGSVIP